MKITLVGSGVVPIPPKKGGATELIIYELSKFLAKNHDVTVFDIKDASNKKRENIGRARYERMWVPRPGNVFLLRMSELAFGMKAFFRTARKNNDVIHCQTVFTALPFAVLRPFVRGMTVYTSHNPAWTNEKNDIFNSLIIKIESFVMKHFDSITTVSNMMAHGIYEKAGIEKDRISVIYNFVDMKLFSPKGRAWKNKKDIKGPMILFVGKLSQNKGVEYFIRAASIVKNDIKDAKFVLVGPMSFEHEAKNTWHELSRSLKLDNTVVFAGPVSSNELPYVYSSADLFCFPTLKEAFGIVIIEAMASGLPVITTDIPVTREVTDNSAIFVTKKDYKGFAIAVKRLLSDRNLMKNLRKKSLERSKYFEKSKVLKNYERVYSAVVEKR